MESKSLTETPTWAVATVIAFMIGFGAPFHRFLTLFGKWLCRTKRKSLLSASDKTKEELMLFGLLSLLMGHWAIVIAKICIKSLRFSARFYPCFLENDFKHSKEVWENAVHQESNSSRAEGGVRHIRSVEYCRKGYESFASYESLEHLHLLMFILGMTHVTYSFLAIALALAKIYSWGPWEKEVQSMTNEIFREYPQGSIDTSKVKKLYSLIHSHLSHPWSQHKFLVWLLCFSRQFWSSSGKADYIALRFGFVTSHELPFNYDFLKYMLRSLDEEVHDIVGISIPLWIYVIFCIFLNFHGTNIYFWISFLPAILILLIGTKLHYIVVQLALEVKYIKPWTEQPMLKLRDELFWFGKPRMLLQLIQFISFQNAFEMAMFLWSLVVCALQTRIHEAQCELECAKQPNGSAYTRRLHFMYRIYIFLQWEIDKACFMKDHKRIHVRLLFGVVSQIWCSFITFPLYVIITQMGSRFKTTVVSEAVRRSLQEWRSRMGSRFKTTVVSEAVRRSLQEWRSRVRDRHGSDDYPTHNSISSEKSMTPLLARRDTLDRMDSIGSVSHGSGSARYASDSGDMRIP